MRFRSGEVGFRAGAEDNPAGVGFGVREGDFFANALAGAGDEDDEWIGQLGGGGVCEGGDFAVLSGREANAARGRRLPSTVLPKAVILVGHACV